MTPTRPALLSPAVGSRQCKASTDLGRDPMFPPHAPAPLPTSFSFPLTQPSVILSPLSFLPSWLFIRFILFCYSFSSLKSVPSAYHQQIYTGEVKQSSQPQEQPMAKLDSINTSVAEALHVLLQSPLPSLTSLALCSQHTPQAHLSSPPLKPTKKGMQASPHLFSSWHWYLT